MYDKKQKEGAEALKQVVDTPVILVGGHRSIIAMNALLDETDIEYLTPGHACIFDRLPGSPSRGNYDAII